MGSERASWSECGSVLLYRRKKGFLCVHVEFPLHYISGCILTLVITKIW